MKVNDFSLHTLLGGSLIDPIPHELEVVEQSPNDLSYLSQRNGKLEDCRVSSSSNSAIVVWTDLETWGS